MQLNMRHRKNGPTGYGILRYSLPTTKKATPRQTPSTFPSRSDVNWSLRQARRLKSLSPVHHTMPSQAHRVVTVLGTQNRLGNPTTGRLVWTMNNISFTEPKTPILHAVKLGIRQKYVSAPNIPTPFNYSLPLSKAGLPITARNGTNVLKVKLGEVVDFVFQNTVSLSGAEEVHPWHLHLGNMWILGYGDNHATWTPSEVSKYKKFKSVERNTFNLYPNSWTAIRVRFDNAGIALFRKFLTLFSVFLSALF